MANTIIQIRRSSANAVPQNGALSAAEPAYSYNSDKLFLGTADGTGVIAIGGKYFVDQQNTILTIANLAYNAANNALTNAMNYAYVNTATQAANTYANTIGAASNGWANTVGSAANTYANNTFLKLTGGTLNGDLNVSGNLTVTGNTTFINVSTFIVDDPLIYLAANNYTSDLLDIGFVGNYNNGACSTVHTGIFRDAGSKEYYVFDSYDKEPANNVIDTHGNNFTISVLNATLRTSNVILNGANLWQWVNNAYSQANAAPGIANSYAVTVGAAANGWANTVGAAANSYAVSVGAAANTNAANASYINTGTLNVAFGGTGTTTFTTNGVLYGNGVGPLQVTVAGTDGQVLVSQGGVPQFRMLDGGTF